MRISETHYSEYLSRGLPAALILYSLALAAVRSNSGVNLAPGGSWLSGTVSRLNSGGNTWMEIRECKKGVVGFEALGGNALHLGPGLGRGLAQRVDGYNKCCPAYFKLLEDIQGLFCAGLELRESFNIQPTFCWVHSHRRTKCHFKPLQTYFTLQLPRGPNRGHFLPTANHHAPECGTDITYVFIWEETTPKRQSSTAYNSHIWTPEWPRWCHSNSSCLLPSSAA